MTETHLKDNSADRPPGQAQLAGNNAMCTENQNQLDQYKNDQTKLSIDGGQQGERCQKPVDAAQSTKAKDSPNGQIDLSGDIYNMARPGVHRPKEKDELAKNDSETWNTIEQGLNKTSSYLNDAEALIKLGCVEIGSSAQSLKGLLGKAAVVAGPYAAQVESKLEMLPFVGAGMTISVAALQAGMGNKPEALKTLAGGGSSMVAGMNCAEIGAKASPVVGVAAGLACGYGVQRSTTDLMNNIKPPWQGYSKEEIARFKAQGALTNQEMQ